MDEKSIQVEKLRSWYDRLERRDPELHARLKARLERAPTTAFRVAAADDEAVTEAPFAAEPEAVFETIVQEGRPALFVLGDTIDDETPLTDEASKLMVRRIMAAADVLNPLLPLIGRIDVVDHPGGYPYVGTGWLIRPGIVCTNRHVANLLGRRDGARFVFSRGRFDRAMEVTLNRRRQKDWVPTAGDAVAVREILWIEPEPGPDLALLRIDLPADGARQPYLELASTDGKTDQFIATIGYPARAYSDTIPDQQWMERIYGGIYDVKRAAPGQLDVPSRSSTTYDCTTLGGASGSPVLDLATGKVLALHYAGLYRVENYGVPASVLRRTIKGRPWVSGTTTKPETAAPRPATASPAATAVAAIAPGERSVTVTVPVTISVSIGDPATPTGLSLDEAVAQLAAKAGPGVRAVKASFTLTDGRAADCIVVAAEPREYEAIRAATPASYGGYPIEVRYATIIEQLGLTDAATEAPVGIAYDDSRRTGPDFSFDEVEEEMTVLAHVGPEQSFPVLKSFLEGAQSSLVSSMYQFHVKHIAAVVADRLAAGTSMMLVLDPQTRDPEDDPVKDDEFDRSETFEKWRSEHEFKDIYVPRTGGNRLVATAYHIKVTVRDGETVWLSSGNWTRASQPKPNPDGGRGSGNREWHVVVRNERLSRMFAAHIAADFQQCRELGGQPEAVAAPPILIDVPEELTEEMLVEAPVRVLDPLEVSGTIRAKPILTPDRRGRVYTDAVIELIRSAQRQLVFQNQYIHISEGMTGNLSELVDALVERAKAIKDVRVILRSGDDKLPENLRELSRRGMDVMRSVKILSSTHTKGIVADGQRVLVGSQNWSSDAVAQNRDASLLFDNEKIAGYFLEAFEIDWQRARPPSQIQLEKPVLRAEGPAPPPGYVRMTLAAYLEG